jgi:hypothetical protein
MSNSGLLHVTGALTPVSTSSPHSFTTQHQRKNESGSSESAVNHFISIMTRAQQTVSIGLLVTSVCKPLLSSKLIAGKSDHAQADRATVLPSSLLTAHSTSKPDFGTDHSSCTLCLLLLKTLLFLEHHSISLRFV